MKTSLITHARRTFLIWSAASRAARLSIFGFIGGIMFLSSENLACKAVLVGAVFGLAVLVGVTWYSPRCVPAAAPTGGGGLRWIITPRRSWIVT